MLVVGCQGTGELSPAASVWFVILCWHWHRKYCSVAWTVSSCADKAQLPVLNLLFDDVYMCISDSWHIYRHMVQVSKIMQCEYKIFRAWCSFSESTVDWFVTYTVKSEDTRVGRSWAVRYRQWNISEYIDKPSATKCSKICEWSKFVGIYF